MPLNRALFSCLVAGLCIMAVRPAAAVVIFQESFEGTGYYTVTGGGNNGNRDFWSVLPSRNLDLGFTPTGADGDSYFGGRDLDAAFGGYPSSTLERSVTFDAIDLSKSINAKVTISLAAQTGAARFEKQDYISLGVSLDGGEFELLDEFRGPARGSGLLTSSINGSLTSSLTDFTYSIADDVSSTVFRIQAFNNGTGESIAFDNLRVTNQTVSEPSSVALMVIGLAAAGIARKRKLAA